MSVLTKKTRIGLDFDNTIVCYDALFFEVACQRQLIPQTTPKNKQAVRDAIHESHGNDVWTALQADVYGDLMVERAAIKDGFLAFLEAVRGTAELFIVSHKTKCAVARPELDLHAAATKWLQKSGLSQQAHFVVGDNVFFEETLQAKLQRIAQLRCDIFIDDLTDVLTHDDFPKSCRGILLSADHDSKDSRFTAATWQRMSEEVQR